MAERVGITGKTADQEQFEAFNAFKARVLENPDAKSAYDTVRAVRQLTDLRIAQGMTQKQVAEKMGVKRTAVSRFEREAYTPRVRTLLRYASAIGVALDIVVSPSGVCSDCGHLDHGDTECGEIVGYDHLNGDHECGCIKESALLSRMLFEAREAIDMYGDITASQTGKESEWLRRIRDEIDEFRESKGWSPHGFGGEADAPHIEPT